MKKLPIGIQTFSEIIENNYVVIPSTIWKRCLPSICKMQI